MQKSMKLSVIGSIALFSVIGCGGGGSSTPSNNIKTGKGHYVDNAVKGVDYVCGSQTGKTDDNGTFIFEKGKECKFTLAGVPLRTTKADELVDGKKIVEDNPKVARLLQSIDSDANLSNGIQITDEVIEALTKALEATQSTGKLPEGDTLIRVVDSVGQDVEGVSGEVRTDEEVEAHLTQTQTEVTKELLAGKTFYVYFIDHDNADTPTVREIKFNDNATSFTDEIGHVINAQIKGNVVTLTYPDGGTDVMTVTTNNDKYILLYEDEEDWFKLFYSEADAKAALEAENGGDSATQTEATKELLAGKTFYLVVRDRGIMFDKMVFNSDLSSVKMSGIDGQDKGETFTLGITVNKDKMIFSDTPNKYRKIIDTKDKYLVMQEYIDSKVHGESARLYYSESDAKAYFDSLNSGDSADNTLKDLIVGKTYYLTVDDADVQNPYVETLQFSSDGHTLIDTWQENGETKTDTSSYSVTNDTLNISGINGDGESFNKNLNAPVTETNDYISFSGHDSRFYKSYAAAQAALDVHNNTVGQYSENGKIVKVTRASANMNHSNPPIFQFNFKHDIGDDRDMVQINTQYKSQAEFDNALVDNSININKDKLYVGMEIAGQGWQGNQEVSNDFSITVIKNNDGTYNLESNGYFVTNGRKIENISVSNILQ